MTKIENSVKKAWKDLAPHERKEMVKEMVSTGGISAAIGGAIAFTIAKPDSIVLFAPLLTLSIPTLILTQARRFTVSSRRFARLFHKHHGKPIHKAREELQRSRRKLRKVM